MRDQIAAKLKNISNLEDRLILKNVLNEVLLQLYDHSSTMYNQLEQRVFAEMEEVPASYDIYATAVFRQNFDPVHYFLRPMQKADLQDEPYHLTDIKEALLARKSLPLTKVFFSCPYPQLQQIFASKRIFHGRIFTDKGSRSASFSIRQDKSYLAQIVHLYQNFIDNNIPWKTVNHPFIFRFAQVVFESCEDLMEQDENINKVEVDFAEFGPYVHYDVVPLWNVETLQLKGNGFPIPCGDKINFEHTISLEEMGSQHGYLTVFEHNQVRYCRRTEKSLLITAPNVAKDIWQVIRIIRPDSEKDGQYDYPLLSNAKNQEFTDILSQRSLRVIRTEGELRRLITSFVAAEDLQLQRIELMPRGQEAARPCENYEMNSFITDEIRRSDYQSKLLLYFTATARENFLLHDLISFVVSEIQRHYPDYKCEGVLL